MTTKSAAWFVAALIVVVVAAVALRAREPAPVLDASAREATPAEPPRPSRAKLPPRVRAEAPTPSAPDPAATPAPAPELEASPAAPAPAGEHRFENIVIPAALDWLKRRQGEDGGWGGPGRTGVALLAFLGNGETHQSGSSKETVWRGLVALTSAMDSDGRIVPPEAPRSLRDQALARLALIEAYGMTESKVLREPAQRAANFAAASMRAGGGWNFPAPDADRLDLETTGFMVMTLKSAQMSGLEASKDAIRDTLAVIERVTDAETGRILPTAADGTPDPSLSGDAATAIGMIV